MIEEFLNQFTLCDSLTFMDDCVSYGDKDFFDFICTDPPYNRVGKVTKNQNKINTLKISGEFLSYGNSKSKDYQSIEDDWDIIVNPLEWNRKWLHNCKVLMKPSATLMVFCSFHNLFDVGKAAEEEGLNLLNIITLKKRNPMPLLSGRNLTYSCEYILWYSKCSNWNFNYSFSKDIDYLEDSFKKKGKQMHDCWMVTVNRLKDEVMFNLDENGGVMHKTQKPLRWIERCFDIAFPLNDQKKFSGIVLDCFGGTGTICDFAERKNKKGHNIQYVVLEKNERYLQIGLNRIKFQKKN